jgi:hypothetical protein
MLSVGCVTVSVWGRGEGGRGRSETATSRARVQNLQELRRLERQLPAMTAPRANRRRGIETYTLTTVYAFFVLAGVAQKSPW